MSHLEKELSRLTQLADAIKNSGAIAPSGCWIDEYKPGGRKTVYARKRSDKPIFETKDGSPSKTEAIGAVGGPKHTAFTLEIARRNALAEIDRRVAVLQGWIDKPVWKPEGFEAAIASAPPLEIDQTTFVPPATVATTTKPSSRAKTFAKKKRTKRKPIYSLMKTKQGSRIHAIRGAAPTDSWYKAALCGTKPPTKTLGWEVPRVNDGVSCPGCLKILPQEYERHYPELL